MLTAELNRHYCQPSDALSLETLANELIVKGSLLLGAGLGLYVTLRLLKGEE